MAATFAYFRWAFGVTLAGQILAVCQRAGVIGLSILSSLRYRRVLA